MEKFKISIDYTVNGTHYNTNLLENEHFKIASTANTDHVKLVLTPNGAALENVKFSMTVPYTFKKEQRVFINGYQSWTDCREYFIDEAPIRFNAYQKFILKNNIPFLPFGSYGDYAWKKYDKRAGVQHGYSYGYIRNGKNYELFGSLSEREGYTIINFVCPENKIVFERELEGVAISDTYTLMDVVHFEGDMDTVYDNYFDAMNIPRARVNTANGYTTWYNYYQNINEDIVVNDLEALAKVDAHIDIFQIDDGFQTAVGDWLSIDAKKFPNGMKYVADKIHDKNMKAGLWLAPLGCQYGSKVAKEHPDWLIRDAKGKAVKCGMNWGGFYALDIEIPEVREYIRHFFDVVLNEWGFDMVKLDFLYAACIIPNHGKSRGQLMCEAMDFIRECVGDKLILGCGVPLAPAFGKVDYCRVGADVGLKWVPHPAMHREDVSTPNTLGNTIFRRGLDGRAFRNDPDVFLLRDYNIKSSPEQLEIIATVNHIFGSLLFTSDDVSRYGTKQMETLLHVFNTEKPEVISAEFSEIDVLDIRYIEEGVEKNLKFNLRTGKKA